MPGAAPGHQKACTSSVGLPSPPIKEPKETNLTLLDRFPGSKMAHGHAGTPYWPNVTFWATAACNIPVRPETLGTNKQRTYRMAAGRALQEVRFGLESLSSQVSSLWPRGLGHCARCEQLWRPAIAHLAYPPREKKSTGYLTWASVLPLGIIFEKREHLRFFLRCGTTPGATGAPQSAPGP